MQRRSSLVLAILVGTLALAGCRLTGVGTSPVMSPSTATDGAHGGPTATADVAEPSASSPQGGAGVPLGDVMTIDWDQLRAALLGEEPWPSGWEAEVDRIIDDARREAEAIRIPDASHLDPIEGSCALWAPLVGHTSWATGAFLERQAFIAHVAALAEVAPDEIRAAAEDARDLASSAAAEQMEPDGDRTIISQHPNDAIETIGRWAVERCDLTIEAAEPPDTEDWTDEDIARACDLDRTTLETAQEEFRAGPGQGRYAEHPHLLEVTIRSYAYTQWHRAVVDDEADPPTLRVEPIPGGFCDT